MDHNQFERRGLFDGLRVPFDPTMLVLALAAVVGFHWIILFLEWFMDVGDLLERIVTGMLPWTAALGLKQGELSPMQWLATVLVGLAFWSFFSVAINRIAAMKLAREEAIGLKEACQFGLRKMGPVLGSVVVVVLLYVGFYYGVNSTLFGWIGRVPYIGELLIAVLYWAVLGFTFLMVVAVLLGLLGFNLASSAIATESSDTWDGLSRAWNYILVRPWTVLMVFTLTAAYITIFAYAGSKFMAWSVDSLAVGRYGMGDVTLLERVEGKDLEGQVRIQAFGEKHGKEPTKEELQSWSEEQKAKYKSDKQLFDSMDLWFAYPHKVAFLRGYVEGRYAWSRVPYQVPPGQVDGLKQRYGEEGFTGNLENLRTPYNVAFLVPWTLKLSGAIIWCWRWVCIYLMAAYALQYLLGANTMLYFLLRKDVEGEDYGEIVVDEEDFEDESTWAITEPQASADESLLAPVAKPDEAAGAEGKADETGSGGEADEAGSEGERGADEAGGEKPAEGEEGKPES